MKKDRKKSGGFISLIKELFKSIGNLLLNSKFSIDELINIVRPVVYVYCILRFGRRSFKPIKISLALDIIQAFFSLVRILRSHKERRKMNRESLSNTTHQRPLASQSSLIKGPLASNFPETDL